MRAANTNNTSAITDIVNKQAVKSKVKTGLVRSKSAYGGVRLAKKKTIENTKDQYRLDLTPHQRVEEDLHRKIAPQVKTEIRGQIDEKYLALEQMLS